MCKSDRAIAFFPKNLSPAEKSYTTNDHELLGLIFFLERFRSYIERSSFEIFTEKVSAQEFLYQTQAEQDRSKMAGDTRPFLYLSN